MRMWSSCRISHRFVSGTFFLFLIPVLGTGCAGARPTEVSPAEIGTLEAQIEREPTDWEAYLRYAAALFATDQCDSATVIARRGWARLPANATGPLVLGQCAERVGQYDEAITAYRKFLMSSPEARGAAAVRAREVVAVRARAGQRARQALTREAELAAQPPNPSTVAVLPLEISGDSIYQPLSRGLAQMLTSDFALLRRFPLVERLDLHLLLEEMALAETGRVDSSTAARVGHLIQAGRMVQGLAAIPPEGAVRLEAMVVQANGQTIAPGVTTGPLKDLLRMEKALVIELAPRMGYLLSAAERRRILENGTQNLVAFLAYSRGLMEEDAGNYQAAARHYAAAVKADPGFRAARERYEANALVQLVEGTAPAQVTLLAAITPPSPNAVEGEIPTLPGAGGGAQQVASITPTQGALTTAIGDLAATQAEQTAPGGVEQTTQEAGNTVISQPPPTFVQNPGSVTIGTIRIIFRIP